MGNWIHYCDDAGPEKRFVVGNMKKIGEIVTRKYATPYESTYIFDTVQVKNLIYFSGGGGPATASLPEQFYQITMRVTLKENMDIFIDKLANMNVGRANHTMLAASEHRLYVVGGTNVSGSLSSCEEFDVVTGKWHEVASLNEKKKWVSACICKERYLYVFCGAITDKKASDMIECLDITKKGAAKWEVIKLAAGKELWKGGVLVGAVPVSDTCVLLFGGVMGSAVKDECAAFDTEGKKIEKREGLLKADTFYRTKWGQKDGKIAIVGSTGGDLHVFDKATGKWGLTVKAMWNPDFPDYKSDTF